LIVLYLLSYEAMINCPLSEVTSTVQRVITDTGYEIGYKDRNNIITAIAELSIKDLSRYIIEEFPDDNPGWSQARVQIFIKLKSIDADNTKIEINAGFERFGTPSALLLIPPDWRSAQSNGSLEEELMDKINSILSTREEK
ncbi:MAG: hypothetical protein ABIL20_06490, partial [candidate division WOR-3 bacterium]